MINPEAKRAARQRQRRMLANIERAQGARADWDRWTNPPEPSRSQRKRVRDSQRKQRRADEAALQAYVLRSRVKLEKSRVARKPPILFPICSFIRHCIVLIGASLRRAV